MADSNSNGKESTYWRLDSTLTALNNSLLSNRHTGMGISGRDPFTQTQVGYGTLLGEQQLRALYRSSWFIRRAVDELPNDMVRAGVDLIIHDGDEDLASKALQVYRTGGQNTSRYTRQRSGGEAFRLAQIYARWFGRGYIVMRCNGAEDPQKPLRSVRSIEGLSVLDRYQMRPAVGTINPDDPEYYEVFRGEHPGVLKSGELPFGQRIHASRVLVFNGNLIHPYDVQLEGDGGHDSVIQAMYDCFVRHYMAKDAINKGLDSFSLLKVAIAELSNIIGSDGGIETLTEYLNTVQQQLSLHNILLQDADASNSEFQERSFAGVSENFQHFIDELTAASGLAYYKIWGTVGRSALADSGSSERRSWADTVNMRQYTDFSDNHRRLFTAIFDSIGEMPDDWEIVYPSIYTPTQKEEEGIKKSQAARYEALVKNGIISPQEAKLAIASGQDLESVLDPVEIRRQMETDQSSAGMGSINNDNDAAPRKGSTVTWNWSGGTATGTVRDVFPRRVQRTISGSKIVRNGTENNPALLIEQNDGSRVLKLASEVSAGRNDDADNWWVTAEGNLLPPDEWEKLANISPGDVDDFVERVIESDAE